MQENREKQEKRDAEKESKFRTEFDDAKTKFGCVFDPSPRLLNETGAALKEIRKIESLEIRDEKTNPKRGDLHGRGLHQTLVKPRVRTTLKLQKKARQTRRRTATRRRTLSQLPQETVANGPSARPRSHPKQSHRTYVRLKNPMMTKHQQQCPQFDEPVRSTTRDYVPE